MAVLGDRLSNAREKKGLSASQAALETHIRINVIEALEAGDYEALPPAPFTRGLLRNYARFLGIDPELAIEDYEIETGARQADQLAAMTSEEGAPPATSLYAGGVPAYAPPAQPSFGVSPRPEPFDSGSGLAPAPAERAAPAFVIPRREPVFQVAPEFLPEPHSRRSTSVTFVQRVSQTRIPELIGALAVLIAIFALGLFAYGRFIKGAAAEPDAPSLAALSIKSTSTPIEVPTERPTAVPRIAATSLPPPTKAPTAQPPAQASPPQPTPAAAVPTGPQMTLQIRAVGKMTVRVIADNVEVMNGDMTNETKTWTARERLYVKVENLVNGQVLFQGRNYGARNFGERTLMERMWELNARGVPVEAAPNPFVAPSPAGQAPANAAPVVPTPIG